MDTFTGIDELRGFSVDHVQWVISFYDAVCKLSYLSYEIVVLSPQPSLLWIFPPRGGLLFKFVIIQVRSIWNFDYTNKS